MLQPHSQKKVFTKSTLQRTVVANFAPREVDLVSTTPHVDGWKNLWEILQTYKLPNERE